MAPQATDRVEDENRPQLRSSPSIPPGLIDEAFSLAAKHLNEQELFARVQMWIEEDRSSFLMDTLEKGHSTLAEIAEAIERYPAPEFDESELPVAVQKTLRVSLLRRFFADQLDFLKVAKDYVDVDDFTSCSRARSTRPAARASWVARPRACYLATADPQGGQRSRSEELRKVKCPKTWYIASDSMLDFIHYNNLEDLYDRSTWRSRSSATTTRTSSRCSRTPTFPRRS